MKLTDDVIKSILKIFLVFKLNFTHVTKVMTSSIASICQGLPLDFVEYMEVEIPEEGCVHPRPPRSMYVRKLYARRVKRIRH